MRFDEDSPGVRARAWLSVRASVAKMLSLFGPFSGLGAASASREKEANPPVGRNAGFAALGLLAFVVLAAAGFQRPVASASQFLLIAAGAFAGLLVTRGGWPGYGSVARLSIRRPPPCRDRHPARDPGRWNRHYNSPPPGLPDLSPLARWIAIGVIPQFTIWIAVTVILGTLAGATSSFVPAGWLPLQHVCRHAHGRKVTCAAIGMSTSSAKPTRTQM
jgi:hypothetical protein